MEMKTMMLPFVVALGACTFLFGNKLTVVFQTWFQHMSAGFLWVSVNAFLLLWPLISFMWYYRRPRGGENAKTESLWNFSDHNSPSNPVGLSSLGFGFLEKIIGGIRLKEETGEAVLKEPRTKVFCWGSLPVPGMNLNFGSLEARQFSRDDLMGENKGSETSPFNAEMAVRQVSSNGKRLLFLTDGGYVYEAGNLNQFDATMLENNASAYDIPGKVLNDEIQVKSLSRSRSSESSHAFSHSKCSSRRAPTLVYDFIHLEPSIERSQSTKYSHISSLPSFSKVVFVTCGPQHSAALTQGGELFTWGEGTYGRLGHGSERDESSPRLVVSLVKSRIVMVACGHTHSLALTTNGSVYSWGEATDGRLGHANIDPKTQYLAEPKRVMDFPGIKPFTNGESRKGVTFHGQIVSVSCGSRHSVAIDTLGKVLCWGRNSRYQCGQVTVRQKANTCTNAQLGKRGKSTTAPDTLGAEAVRSNGEVGCKAVFTPVFVPGLNDYFITSASCGKDFTAVLSTCGSVLTWGFGQYGELGRSVKFSASPQRVSFDSSQVGTVDSKDDVDPVVDLNCGTYHVCAVTAGGRAYCWGRNHNNELGISADQTGKHLEQSVKEEIVCAKPMLVNVQPIQHPAGIACGDGFTFVFESSVTSEGNSKRLFDSRRFKLRHQETVSREIVKRRMKEEIEIQKRLITWKREILPYWNSKCKSSASKKLWRKGIPNQIRSIVWTLALGNDLKITSEVYTRLKKAKNHTFIRTTSHSDSQSPNGCVETRPIQDQINSDLPRTFPAFSCFRPGGPLHMTVKNVLETYVYSRPDIGYVQGLSYIAANICLQCGDEYLAFQSLANIIQKEHMYAFFKLDQREIYSYYKVYEMAMRDNKLGKRVLKRLELLNIHPHLYLFNWMQTLFLKVLPIKVANRIWDCFLLEGTSYLIRISVALMNNFSKTLLNGTFEDCIKLLSCSPGEEHHWAAINTDQIFAAVENISLTANVINALNKLQPFSSKLSNS